MCNYARRAFYSTDLVVKRPRMGRLHRIRWSAAPMCRRGSPAGLLTLFTPFCGHVGMEQPGKRRVGPKSVGNLQVYAIVFSDWLRIRNQLGFVGGWFING